MDEAQTTCWLRASERLLAHVEAQRYAQLAHYADLRSRTDDGDDGHDLPGKERTVHPGGAGTPAVSEFAVTDLAVVIRCTSGRADGLLGDALDLRHRMPRLFARLSAGEVPAYKVRMVLRAAAGASEMAARRLDAAVAPVADKVGPTRLEKLVTKVLPRSTLARPTAAPGPQRTTAVSPSSATRTETGASIGEPVEPVPVRRRRDPRLRRHRPHCGHVGPVARPASKTAGRCAGGCKGTRPSPRAGESDSPSPASSSRSAEGRIYLHDRRGCTHDLGCGDIS